VPVERSLSGLSVLMLSPESTGGIGRHVRMLTEGLIDRGAGVTVCAPAGTLERFGLADTAARLVAAPIGSSHGWRQARATVHTLAARHTLTHAHGARAAAVAASAGVHPLVATWHNAPLGSATRRALHRALERYSAGRSALVFGASADLVERARAAGAPKAMLCEVAAPELVTASPAAPMRSLHEPPKVLAIGRLHPQKRLDLLVEVAARWPAGPHRPRFLVAGDGPLAEPLAREAERRDAPVRFLGAQTDVGALLADADVVVLPSDWEARPLAAQEALAAGVPLVATDVGGVRDLVGGAAVLVPPGDAVALAAGLRRVLDDEALRLRLREAGLARARTWPTVDEMVDRIVRQYLDLDSTVIPLSLSDRNDTPDDVDDDAAGR